MSVQSRKLRAAARTVLCALAPIGLIAGAAAVIPHPVVVYNPTPSIPLGYYFRSGEAPAKGKIIAFPVPELGREYANAHAAYLVRGSIIKPIVAVAGDTVCTTGKEGLLINGKVIAPIIERDRNGVQLPHWRGCRQLTSGELFVFSDRIPNSFDSRYYGPVDASQIIGVFRIFWSVPDASEQQIVAKQLAAIW